MKIRTNMVMMMRSAMRMCCGAGFVGMLSSDIKNRR